MGIPEHAERDTPIGDAALRDRPSTRPRIRFATRGTRTSADTALPWLKSFCASGLQDVSKLHGAELCRRRHAQAAPARCRPKASPQLQGLFSSRFSLSAARIKPRVSNCPISRAKSRISLPKCRSRRAGSHKRETGFLWEVCATFEAGEKHVRADTYVRTLPARAPGRVDVGSAETCTSTPKALALLSFIADRPGEVVTKDQLFGAVWPEVNVGDAALVTCIQELRARAEG